MESAIALTPQRLLDSLQHLIEAFFIAIPTWLFWTKAGIAASLFPFLPASILNLSFIEIWGTLFLISLLTDIISTFVRSLWRK